MVSLHFVLLLVSPNRLRGFFVDAAHFLFGTFLCCLWSFTRIFVRAASGRSTVHRWVQDAARAVGKVLQRCDPRSKADATSVRLDEVFFHSHPVFVGVEPQSMTLILAHKAERLNRAAWLKRLVGWNTLRYVVCDAGTVLQSALSRLAARRQNCVWCPRNSVGGLFAPLVCDRRLKQEG